MVFLIWYAAEAFTAFSFSGCYGGHAKSVVLPPFEGYLAMAPLLFSKVTYIAKLDAITWEHAARLPIRN